MYPNRIWNKSSAEKKIFLTFDDGPIPEVTSWVLDKLNDFGAKASFFCIGDNIRKNPGIFKRILAEDHTVGNHTYNHLNGWKISSEKYVKNALFAEEIIKEVKREERGENIEKRKEQREKRREKREEKKEKREINLLETSGLNSKFQTLNNKQQTPNPKQQTTNNKLQTINNKPQTPSLLFRPPYGKIKQKQARLLQQKNYDIVMWDVLSMDYNKNISAEKCYQNVIKNAVPGSIIVFHDSLKAEKNLKIVLPAVLEYFREKGFSFAKL